MQDHPPKSPLPEIVLIASEQPADLELCHWLEHNLGGQLKINSPDEYLGQPKPTVDLLVIAPTISATTDLDDWCLITRRLKARLLVCVLASQIETAAQAWQAGADAVIIIDTQCTYGHYLKALIGAQLEHVQRSRRRASHLSFFAALLEQMPDSIYFKDKECRLQLASHKMLADLGVTSSEQIAGQTDLELFGPEFGRRMLRIDRSIIESGRPVIGMIESRRLPGGQVNWTSTSKVPLFSEDGRVNGLIGITREINEIKQAELDLQFLATHDHLTRLPNRYLMEDRLQLGLAAARRHNRSLTLVFIDLDGFKPINDRYGHLVGDQVLTIVANRLRNSLRESDTVARLGGDEFVAILESTCNREILAGIAHQLCQRLAEPYKLPGQQLQLTASLGLSCYPQDGLDPQSVIEAADAAMYTSKQRGGNCYSFYSDAG